MKILKTVWQAIVLCSMLAFLMVVTAIVIKTVSESVIKDWAMLLMLVLVLVGAVGIMYQLVCHHFQINKPGAPEVKE